MNEQPHKIDIKNKKILFELDKNSRLSISKIGKKIGLSQEVTFNRVNKLLEQNIIKRFQTVVAISKIGFVAPKIYLQLQNTSKKEIEELQNYLIQHKKVFWFGICQGRWDLIIGYWSKNAFEFGELMDELLNKFSKIILEREITFGKDTIQFNRKWLYPTQSEIIETKFESKLEKNKLDHIEEEILKYLANNARLTTTELAKLINITPSIIRYKLKQLETKQIISGYKLALNTHKLGYENCKAFIYFKNITEKRKKELIQFCKQHPQIINIVLCVGSWDFEIEMEVKNFEQYYTIMEDIKEIFKDIIKNYESVIFKDEPKQAFFPDCYPKLETHKNK